MTPFRGFSFVVLSIVSICAGAIAGPAMAVGGACVISASWLGIRGIVRGVARKYFGQYGFGSAEGCEYYEIPYDKDVFVKQDDGTLKQEKVTVNLRIRKPSNLAEWAFVTSFVAGMGVLIYKLHGSYHKIGGGKAVESKRDVEIKKAILAKYKKYSSMAMFSLLFPISCCNSSSDIILFVQHVSSLYRSVAGINELVWLVGEVSGDLFGDFGGGAEAVADKLEGEEKDAPTSSPKHMQAGSEVDDDDVPEEEEHVPSEEDEHEVVVDAESDEVRDARRALAMEKMEIRRVESYEKHLEIMRQEAESKDRKGNSGLGYYNRSLSGVMRRWYRNVIGVFKLMWLCFYSHIYLSIRNFYIKHNRKVNIVVGVAATVGVAALVFSHFNKKSMEGGKKRKRDNKQSKNAMAKGRAQIARGAHSDHPVSGKSDQDLLWRQRQADEEAEKARAFREELEKDEKRWGHSESKKLECVHMANCPLHLPIDAKTVCNTHCGGHNCLHYHQCKPGVVPIKAAEGKLQYENMSKEILAAAIQSKMDKWVSKNLYPEEYKLKIKELNVMHEVYARRFGKSVEQLRPGFMPSRVPDLVCLKAYYKNRSAGFVSAFTYNNSLFVPRHGVAGAERVCALLGGKEVELPQKSVPMRNGTDQVMYPMPAGMKSNKGMTFRAPRKGEFVCLYWIRQDQPSSVVNCVGTVGDEKQLGNDRSLKVVQFVGSSEDGSCGGIYISGVDGCCVGVHGIGSSNVTAKPEFFPFTSAWIEELAKASTTLPSYLAISDDKYYANMKLVINDKDSMKSLNF